MKSKPKQAPEGGWENYIATLATNARTNYSRRNEIIREVRKHRMMEYEINVPEKFKTMAEEIKLPFTFDILRRAIAILSDSIPNPKRVPLDESDKANSSVIEDWLSESYNAMSSFDPVYSKITDALPTDGIGVWKVCLDMHDFSSAIQDDTETSDEYLKRDVKTKRAHFPFSWEHIDSLSYHPIGNGRYEVLEITKRECLPIARQYKMGLSDGKLTKKRTTSNKAVDVSWPSDCEFIEYWNEDIYIYMVDGEMVEWGEHFYGRPPYFCATASTISDGDPAHSAISFAFPIISLEVALSNLLTIQMNWAKMNGFPSGKLHPISDDAIGDPFEIVKQVVIKPGDIMGIPLGYDFGWVIPPPAGADMSSLRDWLAGVSTQMSLAPVLQGVAGSNMSNSAAVTMIAVAKSIFGPAVKSLQSQFNEMAAMMLYIVDNIIKTDVPLWTPGEKARWLSINSKNIDGYYKVSHEIKPVIPAEQYQKTIVLEDGNARGLLPDRVVVEDGFGYHDPESIADEVWLESMTKTNMYKSYLWGKFMETMGETTEASPNPGQGTPQGMPIAPGGVGAPVVTGVSQPMYPGAEMTQQPQQATI
jgi:hypothetical protein